LPRTVCQRDRANLLRHSPGLWIWPAVVAHPGIAEAGDVAQINRSIISGCLSKICHLRRKCTIDLRSATDTDVDQLKSFWNFNAKLQVVDNARFKVPGPSTLVLAPRSRQAQRDREQSLQGRGSRPHWREERDAGSAFPGVLLNNVTARGCAAITKSPILTSFRLGLRRYRISYRESIPGGCSLVLLFRAEQDNLMVFRSTPSRPESIPFLEAYEVLCTVYITLLLV
jgi:hypothetical protein